MLIFKLKKYYTIILLKIIRKIYDVKVKLRLKIRNNN